MTANKDTKFQIIGKTAVFIDFANVFGWRDVVGYIDPKDIFKYLKSYSQIDSINLFYGTDDNIKSKKFLKEIKKIGYHLVTKKVKYIVLGKVENELIKKRKCDFDIEICMSTYEHLEKNYDNFIFFSGDGDFAPLYNYLIKRDKRVIVVYSKGHIGREIWEIKKGLFKVQVNHLGLKKNHPRLSSGRD